MSFIAELAADRRKFLEGLDANHDDINLDIFEDFYPDRAHFIFELLQNAEDARATTATFTVLKNERCLFDHDGEPFTESDVRRITGIHNSDKTQRPDQIGQFGIGFKSVFAYTIAPEIRSGEFAFRILRFVLPECIDTDAGLGNSTRIEIPFNRNEKSADDASSEIVAVLNSLPETALLFLTNIKILRWRMGENVPVEIERIAHLKNHVEVRKTVGGELRAASHFLLFDEPVKGLEKKRLAIAFVLDLLPKTKSFRPESH